MRPHIALIVLPLRHGVEKRRAEKVAVVNDVSRTRPDPGESIVNELLHFGLNLYGGQSAVLAWIGSLEFQNAPMEVEGHVMAQKGISPEFISAYPLVQDSDPLNIPYLREFKPRISILSSNYYAHFKNAKYLQFLSKFQFFDELAFVISSSIKPVAIFSIFSCGSTTFQNMLIDSDSFHRYAEFTFGFHPWASIERKRQLLRNTYGLTPAEVDILELIERGASNAEISEIQKIALSTVKTHVVHILDKMGADSRNQLSALTRQI